MNALPATLVVSGPSTAGRLIYSIGDIHGRDDLFALMVERIADDAEGRRSDYAQPPLLVLLGDYVDRGRQSPQVLDRLISLENDARFETRPLLGNHEEAMLDFLDGRNSGRGWARFGGRTTMAAYGVQSPLRESDVEGWEAAREALKAAVPASHVALLRKLEPYLVCGDVLFVHAGVRPGVPLAAQVREDLLGIRSEFLDVYDGEEHFVVHGHTPVEQCDLRARRLNLDTGAFVTGVLSAARFDGSAPVILNAAQR